MPHLIIEPHFLSGQDLVVGSRLEWEKQIHSRGQKYSFAPRTLEWMLSTWMFGAFPLKSWPWRHKANKRPWKTPELERSGSI